jgi:MFS family permease
VHVRLRRYFAGLSGDTFLLALASLFADVSSEMLYPVMPIFLTQTLGAGGVVVGLVEGVAQAAQNVVQGLSGWLSDRLRRRKPIALAGFVFGAVAKPLIGLATGWPAVLGARSLERLASGVRSAPRDALVAASADESSRGKAFGLEGAGDNLGAFLGPLLALALLGWFRYELSWIFLLAFVPGVLAATMILFVRERPIEAHAKSTLDLHFGRFPRRYWAYLGVTALFGVGNSSNAFLLLRLAGPQGRSLPLTVVVYALYNLVAALASYPAGHLSDRFGRKVVLLAAFAVFGATYAGFAACGDWVILGALLIFYGVYHGLYRSVGKALATDLAPADLRASGVGWYSTTVGLSGLVANAAGGLLWDSRPEATFWLGAATALLGGVALVAVVPRTGPKAA